MTNLVEFGKGTATSEQDLLVQLHHFIVSKCGWELFAVYSDTSSYKDYIYYSEGTIPGRYKHMYARWVGFDNKLYNTMHTLWKTSPGDSDGELYNADYSLIPADQSSMDWWAFGDLDGIWVVLKNGSSYYSSYNGLLDTYYPPEVDDVPFCNIGQVAADRWYTGNRILMYNRVLDPWGTAASGTARRYLSSNDIYTNTLQYHDPSDRDGTDQGHMPIVVGMFDYSSYAHEVRGELKHTLWFPGTNLSNEDWYTISGTNYKYFITSYSANNTQGYGPVLATSGTDW
jgi:hypothetical protein